MLQRLIDFHLKQRWVVLVGVALIIVVGVAVMLRITVEDLSGRILDQGRPSEPQPDRRTGHG